MPSRKALEGAGRGDLVRGVLAAGGFLAVAQELGPARAPPAAGLLGLVREPGAGTRAGRAHENFGKPQGHWGPGENLEQVRNAGRSACGQ